MANEYLKRTPTSTGNQKVWTLSTWIKQIDTTGASGNGSFLFGYYDEGASPAPRGSIQINESATSGKHSVGWNPTGSDWYQTTPEGRYRDNQNWYHLLVAIDTTTPSESDGVQMYFNGVKRESESYLGTWGSGAAALNIDTGFNSLVEHYIGAFTESLRQSKLQYSDFFYIDGQQLGPEVFGFYKVGKGYISAGSAQATDFRPGQWVPKTPRVIKTAINNSGGFGVNGFYLPLNDSNNFGADFHCEPNSIIKLQENLPQPRCRIDGVGDYTGALRDDPFKQYLVLALPFVSGGLQSGFGDYSAAIKGSGTAKVATLNGNVAIANTASYYGSSSYFDGNGDYLRTSTNISDFQFGTGDFTIETWLWKSANGVSNYDGLAQLGTSGSGTDGWFLEVSATRGYLWFVAGSGTYQIQYNVSPNTSQWNHLAVCRKGNTTTMYLNGSAVGTNTNAYTVPATATTLDVGRYGGGPYWFNGYLQDLRVYKGVAKYKGGFDVPRPYTPVGIATWRAVSDSTANNFATLNAVVKSAALSDGNLTKNGISAAWSGEVSTIGINTGKWYQEYYYTDLANNGSYYHGLGIRVGTGSSEDTSFRELNGEYWGTKTYNHVGLVKNTAMTLYNNGNKGDILSGTFTGAHTIMQAIDASTGKCWWGIDGTWANSGNPTNGTGVSTSFATGSYVIPTTATFTNTYKGYLNFGQNPSFSGNTTAGTFTDSNSKGLFKYEPPSGFLALCEDNLPTPAISDPGKYFKSVLWTGTGKDNGGTGTNGAKPIVGIGFTPDLVWIKNRDNAEGHWWWDSVRGFVPNGGLRSNLTDAETQTTGKQSYVSGASADGFSITENSPGSNGGEVNYNGRTYVAWCWRAGAGTTSTNTNGSITSVVSVNQDAGFSIVSYTGTGANATVGHGLGKTPSMVIVKNREASTDWTIYHKSITATKGLFFTTAGASTSINYWNNTEPTSSVISLGISGGTNNTNKTIAYCWAEIEGFSKFGSYVGNGSADGPFVYTGGRPAFVMIKRTDSTGDWYLFDSSRNSSNPVSLGLISNTTQIDGDYTGWGDFLSNGFKIRRTDGAWNASGGTYIFACWMESPFTTANSK